MPTLVGLKMSTFDAERYRREVGDNHGETLTTEGVLAGLAAVDALLTGEHDWVSALMDTPFYLQNANPHDHPEN